MARTRSVKPNFFLDADVAACSPLARLLFISLWQQADREGRIEYVKKRIKLQALPYDDVSIDKLIDELEAAFFVMRYTAERAGQTRQYLYIRTLKTHQHFHRDETANPLLQSPPADQLARFLACAKSVENSSASTVLADEESAGLHCTVQESAALHAESAALLQKSAALHQKSAALQKKVQEVPFRRRSNQHIKRKQLELEAKENTDTYASTVLAPPLQVLAPPLQGASTPSTVISNLESVISNLESSDAADFAGPPQSEAVEEPISFLSEPEGLKADRTKSGDPGEWCAFEERDTEDPPAPTTEPPGEFGICRACGEPLREFSFSDHVMRNPDCNRAYFPVSISEKHGSLIQFPAKSTQPTSRFEVCDICKLPIDEPSFFAHLEANPITHGPYLWMIGKCEPPKPAKEDEHRKIIDDAYQTMSGMTPASAVLPAVLTETTDQTQLLAPDPYAKLETSNPFMAFGINPSLKKGYGDYQLYGSKFLGDLHEQRNGELTILEAGDLLINHCKSINVEYPSILLAKVRAMKAKL